MEVNPPLFTNKLLCNSKYGSSSLSWWSSLVHEGSIPSPPNISTWQHFVRRSIEKLWVYLLVSSESIEYACLGIGTLYVKSKNCKYGRTSLCFLTRSNKEFLRKLSEILWTLKVWHYKHKTINVVFPEQPL